MPEIVPSVVAALGLGLMGAGHCMTMCGGIAAALSLAQEPSNRYKHWLNLFYNLGRITTYSLLGGLMAAFAGFAPSTGLPIARTLAGVLLLLLGLHFLGRSRAMLWLERAGQGIWRLLKPLATALVPVNHPFKAFIAGAVWGWLPCGLVYSALVYAATQGAFVPGAAVMLAFGVGTLPALFLGGLAAAYVQQWFRGPRVRTVVAIGYLTFGLWTISTAWYHSLLHQGDSPEHPKGAAHDHHHQ